MTSHLFAALTCEISCSTLEINLVFPRTHVLFILYLTLSQRDPINVGLARPTDFADSYLRFGACYLDENTTIRFSETISPNSYR